MKKSSSAAAQHSEIAGAACRLGKGGRATANSANYALREHAALGRILAAVLWPVRADRLSQASAQDNLMKLKLNLRPRSLLPPCAACPRPLHLNLEYLRRVAARLQM